jgi:hypothetical protein
MKQELRVFYEIPLDLPRKCWKLGDAEVSLRQGPPAKVGIWWPRIQKKRLHLRKEISKCQWGHWPFLLVGESVTTPLWGKCEVATHIPQNGTWESSWTPENLEFDCKGQNTLHWGVLYTIGKVLECRCPKWPRMSHLDICSTTYRRKKSQESNWQFDSRPLKVENWPDSGVCRWSATHRWKALKENYKFAWDLIPIGGWNEKLWMPKVPGVQTGTISGLHMGVLGKSAIRMQVRWRDVENTIWGKVMASPESRPWTVKWVQGCSWLVPTLKMCIMSSNQLVGWIWM